MSTVTSPATAPPGHQNTLAGNSAVPTQHGDIAPLLLERLDAYKHAVGYLEDYVQATAHQYKGFSKDYDKVLKTVSNPLKEGHHFSQNNGGVATMFENIRSNTMAIANAQLEVQKALEATVLPQLNRLHAEIKHKHKELGGGVVKDSKNLEKSRGATQRQIEHLGTHTAAFESAGGKIDPANDPYVIQRSVFHHLHKQVMDENAHRRDLLDVQNNFLVFEKHVIVTMQGAMQAFYQVIGAHCDRTKTLYGDMAAACQNIPQEFEWTNFTSRHGEVLINPNTPDRTVDSIQFPNQNHASTQPLIQGLLQRKGKIMRSYNASHYVITPAGFFHEFKETNDFKTDPSPEMSLYLPECQIGNPPEPGTGKFNVSGKDTNKSITTKHEFSFKAGSHQEAMKWYEVLSGFTTGKLSRANTLSAANTPISPTAQNMGVLGHEKPPLNTNVPATTGVETATPSMATPQTATGEKAVFHQKT